MFSESEIWGLAMCCSAEVFDLFRVVFVVPEDDRRNSSRHFWNTRNLRQRGHLWDTRKFGDAGGIVFFALCGGG